MKTKFATSAIAAILALGVAPLFGETDPSISAENLSGSDVVNGAGETIGKIKEFVLDPHSKQMRFVVVESGGVLVTGVKSFLVPWEAFQVELQDDDTNRVTLDATTEKLQGAVEYDPNKPIPAGQVYAFWGISRPSQGTEAPEGATDDFE